MTFHLVERITEQLKKYPQVPYTLSEDGTVIKVAASSPTGFALMAKSDKHEYTVTFEGWIMQTTNDDSAYHCFMVGLTPNCRLKVTTAGGQDIAWQAEVKEGGLWQIAGIIKKLSLPFLKRSERVLSNNWVEKL